MKTKKLTIKDFYKKYYNAVYYSLWCSELGYDDDYFFWVDAAKFWKTRIIYEKFKRKR